MVRLIVVAPGFAWSVGLFLMAGYEASLSFTGDYDQATQGTAGIFIGLILLIAAAIGVAGLALMRRGRPPTQRLLR